MHPALRGGRAAFVFLTRVPVGGFPYNRQDWQWSSGWFPFVGAVLGVGYAGLWWAVAGSLGPWVAAALVVSASMLVTGGFHEDGLADTADALGGAYDREKLFVILKDSRVGAFGAMALFAVLSLRVVLLARIDTAAPFALVVTECLSRAVPIWLMKALPYVSQDEVSKSRQVTRGQLPQAALATAWPAAVLSLGWAEGWLSLPQMAGLVGVAVTIGLVTGWRYRVRAGGITGDFLGATQQIGVCGLLMVLAANSGEV